MTTEMAPDFPPMKNDLLLRAARGEETERAPVWVMRQAGRTLPEFMELRKSHSFHDICHTPELAMEATMQPARRYKGLLDAAIIFSDILVIPEAMGMEFIMNPGPIFTSPLRTLEDISKLKKVVDVDVDLKYVFDAITMTRKDLNGEMPLIGFCGAPWTLFAYMTEGSAPKTLQISKTWLFRHPEESKALIMRIADVCVAYIVGQIKAGAQLVQLFDSHAGDLSPHHFAEYSLPSLTHIASSVKQKLAAQNIPAVPMTLFAKGANEVLPLLAEKAGYDVLSLDWCIDPAEARRQVAWKGVALQGNMEPMMLYGGRDAIELEVKRMCNAFKGSNDKPRGWIANLGHGVSPSVKPEDLIWFFQCVHKYSSTVVEDS